MASRKKRTSRSSSSATSSQKPASVPPSDQVPVKELMRRLHVGLEDIRECVRNKLGLSLQIDHPGQKIPVEIVEKIIRHFQVELEVRQWVESLRRRPSAQVQEEQALEEAISEGVRTQARETQTSREPGKEDTPEVEPSSSDTLESPVESPQLQILGKISLEPSQKQADTEKSTDKKEEDSGAAETLDVQTQELEGPRILGYQPDLVPKRTVRGRHPRREREKESERKPQEQERETPASTEVPSPSPPEPAPVRRVRISRTGRTFTTDRARKSQARKKKEPRKKPARQETVRPSVNPSAILSQPSSPSRKKKRKKTEKTVEEVEESRVLEVTEFITTEELASLMGVPVQDVIKKCLQSGFMVTINQRLDREMMELIAGEYGYELQFMDVTEETKKEEEESAEAPEELELRPRPPVVVVMGHVDHGKTKLLDYIRNTNVIAKEAGGITQYIGAYQVHLGEGKTITFLDTPGHEAFSTMRARGARVADIAVIVIAADEGVMPQTREAIAHAQAAGLEIIFAINKIDLENANPNRVRQQLSEMGFLVEDWGGPYLVQEISALKGIGVDELLEKILIVADAMDLKAPINVLPRGYVIESKQEQGLGVVATLLVQEGILRKEMPLVAGHCFCRVRKMTNERGQEVLEAYPGTPVRVMGFECEPAPGTRFRVYENESEARKEAQHRERILREQTHRIQRLRLEDIRTRAEGERVDLNLVLKADTGGTLEAIRGMLQKMETDEVRVRILHAGVGQITESDVGLAETSNAIIVGFNVRPDSRARARAEQANVEIRTYTVIYDLKEDIEYAIQRLHKPVFREVVIGVAEVRQIFHIRKVGVVAGCYVREGVIRRGARVHVVRDGKVVYTGEIDSLKRFQESVQEVREGYECGVHIAGFNDVKPGDELEAVEIQEVKPGEKVEKAGTSSVNA